MSKHTVIFDFDGTIADTLESVIEIINNLSDEFGYKKITPEELPKIRGKRPRDIMRHVGISMFKLPFVVKKTRREINNRIADLKPAIELRPHLVKLKENGCQLGIVTSNIESNVQKFLQANNLDLFDFFYSGKSIFGKEKIINKILHDKRLTRENVYFVGDEVRDIEAGKKSKVITVAVTWGYNSAEVLQKERPDYIISEPSELEKILKI